jgi:hypothetical protein
MKNTDIFQDYDMVVSIPVATLNDQLNLLTVLDVIQSQLILVQTVKSGQYVYEVLDAASSIPPNCACINAQVRPSVTIGESGTNITFVLNFTGGDALFWVGEGPLAQLTSYAMTGWSYGIDVNMALATIAKDDIATNVAVPPNVRDQLTQFTDNMFTVNSLFMDFESTNLLQFTPVHSTAGAAGDPGLEALALFMQFYLKYLVTSGNPYILGYSLTTTPATNYPGSQQVPGSLQPAGTTYTMYYDPADPNLSTLNFVLVTQGGKKTIPGTPGNFDSNWIQPGEQVDGKLIYSHTVLIEDLLLEPFFNEFRQRIYDNIHSHIDVRIGQGYDQARSATPTGLAYDISSVASGDNQYVNSFGATFSTSPGAAVVKLSGTLKFYKGDSKDVANFEFKTVTARASMSAEVTWSGTITLSVEKDASGEPTLHIDRAFGIDSSHHDQYMNDEAKAMSFFADVFGKLVDFVTSGLTMDFFTTLFDQLLTVHLSGIGNIANAFQNLGRSVGTVVLLPAGKVFFFKNPAIDPQGNLSMGLTYKSQA